LSDNGGKCRLRVFKNRVLRKIFRPEREEVRRNCKKLHNEEICDLNLLPDIIMVINNGG
jgi:hypothetical protein